jgi:hypothetical protein
MPQESVAGLSPLNENFYSKDADSPLILSLKGNIPIKSTTIGKIALDTMKIAGIDITVFKSHLLRMASASALLDARLTIEHVMKLSSWKSSQVFLKFYHCARVTRSINVMNSINLTKGRKRGGSKMH